MGLAVNPLATPSVAAATTPLLVVEDLSIEFPTERGVLRAVRGISYEIAAGRTLGVVGESGCGKSMTALAVMGLVPSHGAVGGHIRFMGTDLAGLGEAAYRRLRGSRIAMIFQEPMTALNPVIPVGDQIGEVMQLHQGLSRTAARKEAVRLLDDVGIPSPAARAADYPHQLSGGMRQRAVIAMALAGDPALLIADEPTTALDVTIQAQILELMLELQDRTGMAIQFISHNLGVVSELADEIIVMYAGRVVERATAADLFATPLHPYTRGLIATLPDLTRREVRLPTIPGGVPDPVGGMAGCRFADRCPRADAGCRVAIPPLETLATGHSVACFKAAA
ncbi:MAG TPA: ABC transporter ATP-binding protein [Stellaceae bacterium]|nr:ABC transporter ATP-binding protein [Stellaceae bacterium]